MVSDPLTYQQMLSELQGLLGRRVNVLIEHTALAEVHTGLFGNGTPVLELTYDQLVKLGSILQDLNELAQAAHAIEDDLSWIINANVPQPVPSLDEVDGYWQKFSEDVTRRREAKV